MNQIFIIDCDGNNKTLFVNENNTINDGQHRLDVAKELGIKMIPAVITNFKAEELPIEGQVLKTDAEIRKLFHLPNDLQIRRDENGDIDQVMPVHYMKKGVREEYV